MASEVDVVVVGGGIIGCSIALELKARGGFDEVILLEKGPFLGDGTSTRNSYVIHAGIYYPQDSLKARFCVRGNREIYAFCERHAIPCLNTGKVILAFSQEEIPTLERLQGQGERNGVEGLRIVDVRDPASPREVGQLDRIGSAWCVDAVRHTVFVGVGGGVRAVNALNPQSPRVLASAPTGFAAKHLGWEWFFIGCTLAAVPGMLVLARFAPWRAHAFEPADGPPRP